MALACHLYMCTGRSAARAVRPTLEPTPTPCVGWTQQVFCVVGSGFDEEEMLFCCYVYDVVAVIAVRCDHVNAILLIAIVEQILF